MARQSEGEVAEHAEPAVGSRSIFMNRALPAGVCLAATLAIGAMVVAQQLPSAPPKGFGTSITGSFEGWYENADNTQTFLVGYYNRNIRQPMDIPVGPNNRIEPGGPDLGQPTHFARADEPVFHRCRSEGVQAHRSADMDNCRERPADQYSVPPEPKLHRQPVYGQRGRQHAARGGIRGTRSCYSGAGCVDVERGGADGVSGEGARAASLGG